MVSNEITFEAIDSEGWEVTFDKEPTKVLKILFMLVHNLFTILYHYTMLSWLHYVKKGSLELTSLHVHVDFCNCIFTGEPAWLNHI